MNAWTAFFFSCLLSIHGYLKKSLDTSGAVAAFILGIIIFNHPDISFALILLAFYFSSSVFTKVGIHIKKSIEEDFKVGGQRNATQVFCNSFSGIIFCLADMIYYKMPDYCINVNSIHWIFIAGYIGHFACCTGDTWASELGVLSAGNPWLITTLKKVPKGTNGGISILGLSASLAGGLFIGIVAFICYSIKCGIIYFSIFLWFISIGGSAGIIGSLIDSLLGATLQKSTFNQDKNQITQDFRKPKKNEKLVHISGMQVLDNHQVNLISSTLTSILFASIIYTCL